MRKRWPRSINSSHTWLEEDAALPLQAKSSNHTASVPDKNSSTTVSTAGCENAKISAATGASDLSQQSRAAGSQTRHTESSPFVKGTTFASPFAKLTKFTH